MSQSNDHHPYRFDNFLEEARNLVKKSKAAVYFHLIFCRNDIWADLGSLMEEYSADGRRRWKVSMLRTQQEDFYILEFQDQNDDNERHSFFWKVVLESNRAVILSFSLEKFRFVRSCLDTFVAFAGMEFPWLGSSFLENIDGFICTTFGADTKLDFKRILYDLEPIAGQGKASTNLNFTAASKEDILRRKQTEYESQNKFFYIRRVSISVLWRGEHFLFSVSDEGEILFEKGDLILFLEMTNALRNIVNFYRDSAEKHLDIEVRETQLEEGKKSETRVIEKLDVLKLDVTNPMTENWYENFTTLFSRPYRPGEKLMSFVVMKGNPYFLAQIVDIEKGGSGVYLSATRDSIRISPSGATTSISTVLKIMKALQKYVDPNIAIAGA